MNSIVLHNAGGLVHGQEENKSVIFQSRLTDVLVITVSSVEVLFA